MPDSWDPIIETDLDFSFISDYASVASGAINTTATFLNLTSGAIRVLSVIAQSFTNPLVALIAEIVDQLRELVEDFLQNNAAAAVHINLRWDPDWVYQDYLDNGTLPLGGEGFTAWLQDVYASTTDTLDPYRPLADENTEVQAFFLVFTLPDLSALTNLQKALKVFGYTDDFRFLTENFIDQIQPDEPVLRMGAAMGSEFMRSLSKQKDLVLNGERFLPRLGSTPTWYSVPIAALLPPLQEIFETLNTLADVLDPGPVYEALERLAQILELRAQALEQLADALDRLAEIIESILNILSGSNLLVLGKEAGGLAGLFERAAAAENPPDTGDGGIVAGIVGVATTDGPGDSWNRLLTLFKSGYEVPDTSSLREDLDNTYDPIFP